MALAEAASAAAVEIPGYRIQRPIASGGSGRVFLALQHALARPVAIKVVVASDAAARERFLGAAELARQLDHRAIVRVLDVGSAGDLAYLAMDYLRGGDLRRNLAAGLHVQNVVRVVKEVAGALGYAHAKGVVHCDVKPENILFDEQGAALLSDFGTAAWRTRRRVADKLVAAGSRPYASPEAIGGDAATPQSDFYALGATFYEMLTGRLPFGDAGASAGSRRPPLPTQFAPFEGAVAGLLALDPGSRFGTAAEIVAALDRVQTAGMVPEAVIRTAPIATAEIDAVAAADERVGERDAVPPSRSRPRAWAAALLGALLLIAIGAGGWAVATQERGVTRLLAYAGLVEHPDLATAWQEAEALRLDPNQGLATVVAAYRGVLAEEADYAGAKAAIVAAAESWRDAAAAALRAGDAGLAAAKIDELAGVFPTDAALPGLLDQLDSLRQANRLLRDTQRLLEGTGLADARSAQAAVVTLKEVLRLKPGDVEALAALDQIARHYGRLAAERARTQDVAAAIENFDRAVDANPEFEGVEQVRGTLSTATAVQAEINALVQEAAAFRADGALVDPPGANAAEMYRRVLATKPDDALAVQGLAEVSAQVQAEFQSLLAEGGLDAAAALLERARAAGIGDEPANAMQARYDEELRRIDTVRRLIAEAEAFYVEGYVTGPSQQANAVARLREAQRLDPNNADVVRLLSVSATRLAGVAEEAHAAGLFDEALLYLDLALTVTPGIERWRQRREQWRRELAVAPVPPGRPLAE